MSDNEYRLGLQLEGIANQYGDSPCQVTRQWSGEGLPYQDIKFTMNGKKYVIMFGETDE